MEPGGLPMGEADWRTLVAGWFPELVDTRLRQSSWPGIEPHRDYIAAQLKVGVTAATIHQRLRDEHGLDASVASVRRWVRANLPEDARRAQVTVLRDAPPAGEQAQIDYGRLGMWLDPAVGRRRTVWAFVMVLCCSRHMFVRPVSHGRGRGTCDQSVPVSACRLPPSPQVLRQTHWPVWVG